MELAGGKPPTEWNGKPVPHPPGVSLVPALAKDVSLPRELLWWLHENNRALRAGDWKIVATRKDSPWELYDLSRDRCETKNLAGENPEKVRELAAIWKKQWDDIAALAKADLPKE
jgi:arylsulfatase